MDPVADRANGFADRAKREIRVKSGKAQAFEKLGPRKFRMGLSEGNTE